MKRRPIASVSGVQCPGARVYNVDELKKRLVHVWYDIDQTINDNAIDEWRCRLRACVRAKGRHFEQMF